MSLLIASTLTATSQAPSAVAEPNYVYGSRSGLGGVNTSPTSIIVSGGQPAYTYSWIYFSGDVGFTVSDATNSTAYFSWNIVNFSETASAIWRCVVTDSRGQTTFVPVNVIVSEISFDHYGNNISAP